MGKSIGERIKIAGSVSRNIPTIIRKIFIINNAIKGFSIYCEIALAASCGRRSIVITHPITIETATIYIIIAVVSIGFSLM